MFATRWQPLSLTGRDWRRLQGEMERAFEHLTGYGPRQTCGTTYPAVNLWEEDERFLVEAELPGLELEDIEIYVDGDNQLTLKGERKAPEHTGGTWHRQERGFGSFSRTLELPHDVDAEQVSAEFKYGILTINLPKAETAKPRRIQVQA